MEEMLTTPPAEIGAWLACLAFTTMLALNLGKLLKTMRGKPEPGELSERVTKIEAVQGDHARRLKSLEKNDTSLRELLMAENGKIYDRLNKIAEGLYSLSGKVDVLLKGGAE